MNKNTPVTIAYGDGIGPEIMEATIEILKHARARISFNTIEVGKKVYEMGFNSGLMPSAWQELASSKILLKAPITTPQGGGYKSLNVTLRKKLGLYANVRPVNSFAPYVATKHPQMDVVIVRENEEDLYTGIEHRQTEQAVQCLKIITREGCEKIVRYAFEYAVKNSRKKVTCFSKDNIMKMTDGTFHKIFDAVAKEYPDIVADHYIIDIGTARLAAKPEIFDVIVTLNLYGDIISDVAAEISGSVGLAGSANIGGEYAMFEAIHGSAPDIAGKDIANPTGLLQAAVMMLVHIGQADIANKVRNAVFKTIEDGIHTADIYNEKISNKKVGTKEFTAEVIKRLGQEPEKLAKSNFISSEYYPDTVRHPRESWDIGRTTEITASAGIKKENLTEIKTLIGFDLFIDWQDKFEDLITTINSIESEKLEIKMITAKGLVMWPHSDKHMVPNYPGGHTILRFIGKGITGKTSNEILDKNKFILHQDLIDMLEIFAKRGIDFIKYEGLYLFDGTPGYSSGQGE